MTLHAWTIDDAAHAPPYPSFVQWANDAYIGCVADNRCFMDQQISIGIDTMAIEAPTASVSADVLVESLHIQREVLERHGVRAFRWPSLSEGNSTIYANGLYKLLKFLDGDEKLQEYPILYNVHSSETNAGTVPDSAFGMLMATSKLMAEDEERYYPVAYQLYTALPIPLTWNCAGYGIGIQVATELLIGRYLRTGRKGSAIVSGVDTSVYAEGYSGPLTTISHGSSGVVAYVTFEPRVVEIDPNSFTSFIFNEPGFSKFANPHLPKVRAVPSMQAYSYTLGEAVHIRESRAGYNNGYSDYAFVAGHRPIGSQVQSHLREGYVHAARRKGGAEWDEILRTANSQPPSMLEGFTHLYDSKLYPINRAGRHVTQHEVATLLEQEHELKAYWKWSQAAGSTEGFARFKRSAHVDEGLEWGSILGNSYSVTPLVGLGSVIHNAEVPKGSRGLIYFFGSESLGILMDAYMADDSVKLRSRVLAHLGGEVSLDAEQYRVLHGIISQREGERTVTEESLIEKDLAFLRMSRLTDGFHYINRNSDGTGRWAFVERGEVAEVYPRYVTPTLRTEAQRLAVLKRAEEARAAEPARTEGRMRNT